MRTFGIIVGAVVALGLVQAAHADSLGTYGDATTVVGGYQLTSSTTSGVGYAGVYDTVSGPLTPTTLTQLSADYQMTTGTFGGGAPRFSIIDSTNNTNNEAYVFFGTPPAFSDPANGTTGNYADLSSPDVRVYNNGFGGLGNGNTGETSAQFVASVPDVQIAYVSLDLDGGFSQPGGTQEMLVSAFDVNGSNLLSPSAATAPLPSTAWAGTGLLGVCGALVLCRRKRTMA